MFATGCWLIYFLLNNLVFANGIKLAADIDQSNETRSNPEVNQSSDSISLSGNLDEKIPVAYGPGWSPLFYTQQDTVMSHGEYTSLNAEIDVKVSPFVYRYDYDNSDGWRYRSTLSLKDSPIILEVGIDRFHYRQLLSLKLLDVENPARYASQIRETVYLLSLSSYLTESIGINVVAKNEGEVFTECCRYGLQGIEERLGHEDAVAELIARSEYLTLLARYESGAKVTKLYFTDFKPAKLRLAFYTQFKGFMMMYAAEARGESKRGSGVKDITTSEVMFESSSWGIWLKVTPDSWEDQSKVSIATISRNDLRLYYQHQWSPNLSLGILYGSSTGDRVTVGNSYWQRASSFLTIQASYSS